MKRPKKNRRFGRPRRGAFPNPIATPHLKHHRVSRGTIKTDAASAQEMALVPKKFQDLKTFQALIEDLYQKFVQLKTQPDFVRMEKDLFNAENLATELFQYEGIAQYWIALADKFRKIFGPNARARIGSFYFKAYENAGNAKKPELQKKIVKMANALGIKLKTD